MTGTAKLQLLIDLKNKLGAGLNNAKRQVEKATGDMQGKLNAFKSNTIKAFDAIKSEVPFVGKAIELLKNPFVLISAAAVGTVAIFRRLLSTADDWIKLSQAQTEAETKLAQVMRNTMGASTAEINSIKQLAGEQQKLGVISEDVQLAGAQELATYLTKADSLKQLIPVMDDMLAQQYGLNATQEQSVNIASMLGKVMDGQVGALSRYGYKFDENQEKILKFGTEAQRVATLIDVVSGSVGGVNEALAKTPLGMFKQIENEAISVKTELGTMFAELKTAWLPVEQAALNFFVKLRDFVSEHKEQISTVINFVANIFSTVINAAIDVLSGLKNAFSFIYEWRGVIYGIGGAIALLNAKLIAQTALLAGLKIATTAETVALWLLNVAANANPIGIIVTAIGALIGGLVVAYNKFDKFRAIIKGTWEVIKGFGVILKTYIIDRIKGIVLGLGTMGSAISKLFSGDFSGAWEDAKKGFADISGATAAKNAFESTKNLKQDFSNKYNEVLADAAKKKAVENDGDFAGVTDNSESQTPYTATTTGLNTDEDAHSIKGGSQTKNVTINIGTLSNIDKYSPKSEEINSMNKSEFERWITEMFMRVVRSAELAI